MTTLRAFSTAAVAAGLGMVLWHSLTGPGRQSPPPSTSAVRPVLPPRPLLGAGSCTSSGCHAAAVEGHAPWQSASTVWSSRDPHARGHRVLLEPLAHEIVTALAARDPGRPVVPAHEHVACVGCHATGRGPLASEGVGCESCHGAAGDWLVAHTLPGWRTAGNTLGMVDLADPFTCASQCAGCHVGGPPAPDGAPREVSHDLIAAGHPRLAFELRSFKRAEPPHWRDRFAAVPADGNGLDPLDEWAIGRLGSLHVFLDQIRRQTAGSEQPRSGDKADVWPEFTAFDCYGCHRPAVAAVDREAPAASVRPGRLLGTPRLEPLHWALLEIALPSESAALLASFRADVERRWWERPDADALQACLLAVAAAPTHLHAAWSQLSAGAVADRIVAAVDPANWDEAAAGLAALEAVVDRAAMRAAAAGPLQIARSRLDEVRRLLEFSAETHAGGAIRFDSPHAYDARAVAAALAAAAESLASLP